MLNAHFQSAIALEGQLFGAHSHFRLAIGERALSLGGLVTVMLGSLLLVLFRKRFLLAGIAVSWGMAGALWAQESLLTDRLPEQSMSGLQSLLERAMTQSSSIQIRDLVEENYEGRGLVSESGKQIKLGSSLSYRKEQDLEADDSDIRDRVYYSLTLSKALYHWGALEANKEKGELSLRMEELKTFEAYRNLALDVRRRYLNILIARKDIELSEKNLELYRSQLEQAEERFKSGTASTVQVHALSLSVNKSELDVLRKENGFQDQVDYLARLVGMKSSEIEQDFVGGVPKRDSLETEEIQSLENYFDGGVDRSSSIEQSSKAVEYYEKDLHIANQRRKPKIGMSIGLSQYDLDSRGARRPEEIVYGGVSISWSIFDGAATRGYKKSAIAQLEEMNARFEDAKSTYRFDLERAQRLLDLNSRVLKRDETALELSERHVAEATKDFEEGRVTFDVLGNTQKNFMTQDSQTNRSRAAYFNSLAEMASLLGFDPFAQKFIASRTE